jgi:hypothetical protein
MKPVIVSPSSIEVPFGADFTYLIEATNSPLGFSLREAPFWVEREGARLSGKALKMGEHRVLLNASNFDGSSETLVLTINVLTPDKI